LADELKRAIRRENIPVRAFHYVEDPRFSVAEGEVGAERSAAALAAVYQDHGVFPVGDGKALFDAATGGPRAWIAELARFEQRLLLTQEPTWWQGERAAHLVESGFRLLPLTLSGVAQLGGPPDGAGFDDPRDRPTSRRFAVNPACWLETHAPPKAQVKAAVAELAAYLGAEGFLLACATAAYPGLYTRLTRALDAQLGLRPDDQGLRLRKLARLPC
jgi:hypothetical protein